MISVYCIVPSYVYTQITKKQAWRKKINFAFRLRFLELDLLSLTEKKSSEFSELYWFEYGNFCLSFHV